jgi:hypothetical protein
VEPAAEAVQAPGPTWITSTHSIAIAAGMWVRLWVRINKAAS